MKRLIFHIILLILPFFAVEIFAQAKNSGDKKAVKLLRVNNFSVPGDGAVNSYWLETPQGIVVIDGQRITEEGKLLNEKIKASGKPVIAVLITHAHLDHFGGLGALLDKNSEIPIYLSTATLAGIVKTGAGVHPATGKSYGDYSLAQIEKSARLVQSGAEFEIGGLTFRPLEIGIGESAAATVYEIPAEKIVFVGDLVGKGNTPFLVEGTSGAWLEQLGAARRQFAAAVKVYHGHGEAGNVGDLIDAQVEYLTTFRRLAAEKLSGDNSVSPAEKQAIKTEMMRRYPNFPNVTPPSDLLGMNIDAVVNEMQTANEKAALLDFDRRWQAMATAKNADGMAELYTADADWLPPNDKKSSGRNAVRAAYAKIFALPDFSLVHTPARHVVAASGDVAVEYGVYDFRAKINGADFKDTGKYMFYLAKENGEWRIAADIFNSDAAAQGAATNDK